MGSKTSTEYWHERFGEYPKADIEKLCCAMMSEYANEKTKQQREVIERLKNMSGVLLERLEKRKPQNDYIFSVRIAIKDLQTAVEEAESLLKEIE